MSLLTLFVHLPAVGHGFVNWDDNEYVCDNPHLETIDLRFLGWAFTSFHSLNWHPLTWLSHAVDRQLWRLDPQGHHLGNVLLHTANTFLVGVFVFVLMRCATLRSAESPSGAKAARKAVQASDASGGFRRLLLPSLVAALLFGLHPLHVESVAWVSERKDVLSTFFMLLSALFYLRHAAAERKGWTSRSWAFSLLFFALALLSKPMPLTLPLVFLVLDVYPLKRLAPEAPRARRLAVVVEKVPFLALSAASAVVTYLAQHQGGATGTLQAYPVSTRLLVALRATSFYLAKMVFPAGLSPLYPYPRRAEVLFLSVESLAAAACVVGVSVACIHLWRRGRRAYLAAWFCFLAMLLPVLGLVHFGPQAAADRYTYTTLLPFFILAGIGLDRLLDRSRGSRWRVAAVGLMAASIVCVLCLLTINQSRVWRDSVTLWSRALALYPSSELAYNRRGDAYLSLGDDARALADLSRSIELSEVPFEPSLYRRAKLLLRMGRRDEALHDVGAAISAWPGRSDSYNIRGAARAEKGQADQALADFSRAIELDRDAAEAYHNRAMLLASLGQSDRALADLTRAVGLRPDFAEGFLSRCELHRQRGRHEAALADCTRAVELMQGSAPAHSLRGLVLFALARHAEAKLDLDTAAEIAPSDPEVHINRGSLLGATGRLKEAIQDFNAAIALDPSSAKAYASRGVARNLSGDRMGAIADFQQAARLGNKDIQRRLGKAGIHW